MICLEAMYTSVDTAADTSSRILFISRTLLDKSSSSMTWLSLRLKGLLNTVPSFAMSVNTCHLFGPGAQMTHDKQSKQGNMCSLHCRPSVVWASSPQYRCAAHALRSCCCAACVVAMHCVLPATVLRLGSTGLRIVCEPPWQFIATISYMLHHRGMASSAAGCSALD